MTREKESSRHYWSTVAATIAAGVTLAGCAGGAGEDDGAEESSPAPSEHTEDPVTLVELTFNPVAGMEQYTTEAHTAKLTFADEEWVAEYENARAGGGEDPPDPDDATTQDGRTPATVLVFLEKRNEIDGAILMIESQIQGWDDEAEITTEELDVPGTADAALVKSHYTAPGDDYRSEQWDIVLGMDTTPQYHIRYGAPEDEFDRDGAEAMLESIQVESEYE
ncbi:hypothetical protein [Halostreptopolyspora alba]|uniref:Uncharacterized protein n=1 Tax=Halostreptopolyspora alba TaxID=2487137 RepID=A0A3N0E6M6_9ACTN|nr:hypothetical protein EFW17_16005 [Nocardiopsaceae bacterium YIM 96095]